MRAEWSQRAHRERESSQQQQERGSGRIANESRARGRSVRRREFRERARFRESDAPADSSQRPVSSAARLLASGDYGFLVGRGGTVGMGVRPTGGGVPNGFGLALGDSDGFGAKPQMFQLKRP